MESCSYTCKPNINKDELEDSNIILDTYDENFIELNIGESNPKNKAII